MGNQKLYKPTFFAKMPNTGTDPGVEGFVHNGLSFCLAVKYLQFTASDCPFGIFKHFFCHFNLSKDRTR
jgi:hypothetical protein